MITSPWWSLAGMEEATCEKGVFISNYVNNIDNFNIIAGPAARIRPVSLPDQFFSCKFPPIHTQHHTLFKLGR